MTTRVLICGARDWSDYDAIRDYVATLPADAVIIQGECAGADTLAKNAARERGLTVIGFPAQWSTYGRRAGPIRNAQMISEGMPSLVVAFHQSLDASKGTKDMIAQARQKHIPVMWWNGHKWTGC